MAASTPGLRAYRLATMALSPAVPLLLRQRILRGKEDGARLSERFGKTTRARPDGQLIWIHGASVGECLSVLPLIDALLETPDRHVMVTSGTVTSAQLMEERLPQRAFHQFVPVDTPASVRRFLAHWQPDAGFFVDSEIWPNMLMQARAQNIPLAMINGRMSARSFEGWRFARHSAAMLLSCFERCLAQDEKTAMRLRSLGARNVEMTGSLKADALPLPAPANKLQSLREAIGNRPVLLAASTHPGEDETILPAHDILRGTYPDLLTIIVPRHPARGAEIAMLCGTRSAQRRSSDGDPLPQTAVYVADTLGELGLFYRVAPFAFIGGSLVPHGGQNPLEPAHLGCPVLAGPHTENFSPIFQAIFAAQGAGRVACAKDIAGLAAELFTDPGRAQTMGNAAKGCAKALGGAMEKTRSAIEAMVAEHART